MVLEVKFTSHGVLALAGIICLVLGMLTLVAGRANRELLPSCPSSGSYVRLTCNLLSRLHLMCCGDDGVIAWVAVQGLQSGISDNLSRWSEAVLNSLF